MTNREIDEILRRIKRLREYCENVIKNPNSTQDEKEDAQDTEKMVQDLIKSMCAYTNSVFDDNYTKATRVQLLEKSNSVEEYQQYCENIDKDRRTKHDSLIGNIKLVDMICREYGIAEIYGELPKEYQNDISGLIGEEKRKTPGVVETREAIANWTWNFVLGCTVSMALDFDAIDYEKNMTDMAKITQTYKDVGAKYNAKRLIDEMTK